MSDLHKARAELEVITAKRNSPRFRRVVGRLMASGVFQERSDIPLYRGKVSLKDFLWAGQFEPRIYEVLPAILLKRPSLLTDCDGMPEDLSLLLVNIRKGQGFEDFRGIPARNYLRWLDKIGKRGTKPTLLKAFRFQAEDLEILRELTRRGYNETEAIRAGLRMLKAHGDT